MRFLGLLLALLGAAALVMGIVSTFGAARTIPFSYEATNHAGQIVAGLLLLPLGVYLDALFKKEKR